MTSRDQCSHSTVRICKWEWSIVLASRRVFSGSFRTALILFFFSNWYPLNCLKILRDIKWYPSYPNSQAKEFWCFFVFGNKVRFPKEEVCLQSIIVLLIKRCQIRKILPLSYSFILLFLILFLLLSLLFHVSSLIHGMNLPLLLDRPVSLVSLVTRKWIGTSWV